MGLLPTQGDEKRLLYSDYCSLEAPPSPLSSRPERTRISYFALLATTTCAALLKESRMQIIKATGLHRKSGGAQWRDLCVDALSWKCLAPKRTRGCANVRARDQPTKTHSNPQRFEGSAADQARSIGYPPHTPGIVARIQ